MSEKKKKNNLKIRSKNIQSHFLCTRERKNKHKQKRSVTPRFVDGEVVILT